MISTVLSASRKRQQVCLVNPQDIIFSFQLVLASTRILVPMKFLLSEVSLALFKLTEAVMGYIWLFCCRSKHPPVKLSSWAVAFLQSRLGISFAVLCIDGGGELWGFHALRASLLEANVVMEPTGGANLAANGKAERIIGIMSRQTQLLLFASGLNVSFWCFGIIYATLLVNLRPNSDGDPSSHQFLHKKVPSYANLFRFGSFVYLVNQRLTRREVPRVLPFFASSLVPSVIPILPCSIISLPAKLVTHIIARLMNWISIFCPQIGVLPHVYSLGSVLIKMDMSLSNRPLMN
jgi:hypothetical protein